MKDYVIIVGAADSPMIGEEFDSLEEAREYIKSKLTGAFHIFSRADTITVTREKIEKVSVTCDPKVKRARKAAAK